jgi:polysaccharide biosynthesis/export protein
MARSISSGFVGATARLLITCFAISTIVNGAESKGVPVPENEFRLGPGDHLAISVPFADEINNKPVIVDSSGSIDIAFAGRIDVRGMTTEGLEKEIARRLTPYFESPQVIINVVEYGSKPVSVIGEVRNPSLHQLAGKMTLVELLSASGGLTPEAGSKVAITRDRGYGILPLPNAHVDPSGAFSTGEVDLEPLLHGKSNENIDVLPNDVISVSRAKLIYVLGEVHKPGGFPFRGEESGTALQILSLAEGPLGTAGLSNAVILRQVSAGKREQIPVNLKKIIAQKLPDVTLQPEDVLYLPNSKSKQAMVRGLETALQLGTGIVIWGRY